jgi:hypothetical protein
MVMPNFAFKKLSPKQQAKYREWARKNYHPGDKIDPTWHPIIRAECERIEIEALQAQYVNLYRRVFNTNLGLWSRDIAQLSKQQLTDGVVAFDMLLKLRETKQLWIVGHDVPLSISNALFKMLEIKRRATATTKHVPEEQYEFEDLIGYLIGLHE